MAIGANLGRDAFNALPVNSKPASAFERVQSTLSEARDLAIRVDGIVERLLGSNPSTGETAGVLHPTPSGMLGNMADDAERTREYLRGAVSSLNKLDQALA